jgi:hypothetical protein
VSAVGLGVGVGLGLGLASARWRKPAHTAEVGAGAGAAEVEAELRRLVVDGRDSEVTFHDFHHFHSYLRLVTWPSHFLRSFWFVHHASGGFGWIHTSHSLHTSPQYLLCSVLVDAYPFRLHHRHCPLFYIIV